MNEHANHGYYGTLQCIAMPCLHDVSNAYEDWRRRCLNSKNYVFTLKRSLTSGLENDRCVTVTTECVRQLLNTNYVVELYNPVTFTNDVSQFRMKESSW